MVKGLVRVQEVSANGIFANTEISPGDVCLMVDGVPATLLWHME
jgi:S1-C subfamily serine protease